MDSDWLSEYEAVSSRGQILINKIPERNRLQRNSSAHVRASTEINQILKTFSSDIDRLRALLRQSSLSVTGRELERREALIDSLVTKEKQMQEALRSGDTANRVGSAALFETGRRGRQTTTDVVAWGDDDDEPEATRGLLSNDELRQQQQQIIQDQDEGELLRAVIVH